MGKYHLALAKDGQYYFNLRAGNGERILQSEMYTTKAAALNGIKSCQENSPEDGQYKKLTSKSDQPYFVLRAKNNQVIGQSQMYSSESSRDNGIESCKSNGPTTDIEDETGE